MNSIFDFITSRLSGLVGSVWSQVGVAVSVGLPLDIEARTGGMQTSSDDVCSACQPIRSMDDYAGYLTGNGLGSLDIGGGSSRWGE
jgi:hypothetical protein